MLLRALRNLDDEAKRTVKHLSLLGLPALAIVALLYGPPLSWMWGRDVIRIGNATFSVPDRAGWNIIRYRIPGSDAVLDLELHQRTAPAEPRIPPEQWTEPDVTKLCDRRTVTVRSADWPRECVGQLSYPVVELPPSFTKRPPVGNFPFGNTILVSADISQPLTERWGKIAQGADAYLKSIEASPFERLYAQASQSIHSVLKSVVLLVSTVVLLPLFLAIVFPPIGLALIALLPAVRFSTDKRRLEEQVAAATGHELAGSGDALRRGPKMVSDDQLSVEPDNYRIVRRVDCRSAIASIRLLPTQSGRSDPPRHE